METHTRMAPQANESAAQERETKPIRKNAWNSNSFFNGSKYILNDLKQDKSVILCQYLYLLILV